MGIPTSVISFVRLGSRMLGATWNTFLLVLQNAAGTVLVVFHLGGLCFHNGAYDGCSGNGALHLRWSGHSAGELLVG